MRKRFSGSTRCFTAKYSAERGYAALYPLETLHELLTRSGFRSDGRRLLQDGDPTLNTLMLYTKA